MESPKIINNKLLIYSKGDTFILQVSNDEGFSEDATLQFTIANEEREAALIEKSFSLNEDGTFTVTLTSEIKKLDYGEYVYKMVFTSQKEVITEHSGILKVRWSAW